MMYPTSPPPYTRWNECVQEKKVSGQVAVIQLLECCDNNLRGDLTRTICRWYTYK